MPRVGAPDGPAGTYRPSSARSVFAPTARGGGRVRPAGLAGRGPYLLPPPFGVTAPGPGAGGAGRQGGRSPRRLPGGGRTCGGRRGSGRPSVRRGSRRGGGGSR